MCIPMPEYIPSLMDADELKIQARILDRDYVIRMALADLLEKRYGICS